jgi:hypothetical protein
MESFATIGKKVLHLAHITALGVKVVTSGQCIPARPLMRYRESLLPNWDFSTYPRYLGHHAQQATQAAKEWQAIAGLQAYLG